ncbi:MAG: LysR family transcriptional regulator [Ruminococcus sp.]|jgi:DNA-binding transcriptional LysR family regulator|nr:LysR family transcriptional regulator [Ruminococcus sp.]
MELKQLEYFVVASECGSFNKASECLYTSQPNVSKVVASLEKELGREVFVRTRKGIQLTAFGETMKEYAQNVLTNVQIMNSMAPVNPGRKLSLSTYPSNMVARLLVDFYKEMGEEYVVEYLQGTVEEITDNVKKGISELGIVFIAEKQLTAFQHILSHKNLRFYTLDTKEVCVYVGENNPLFHRDSIDFSELPKLKFIRGVRDYFSMEHHLESVSLGVISTEKLRHVIYSNSDHMTIDVLLHTDICSLGINFMNEKYEQYPIKTLAVNNCEPFLVIGYVADENRELSLQAKWFIERLKSIL